MDNLGSVICYPQFKYWEVNDTRHTLSLDLACAQATPTTVLVEGLHQVAYRLVLSVQLEGILNSSFCWFAVGMLFLIHSTVQNATIQSSPMLM